MSPRLKGLPASKTVAGTTTLPGFGRCVNYTPQSTDEDFVEELLPNALCGKNVTDGDLRLPLTTCREFTMLALMNKLTDEKDWFSKINNPQFTQQWKEATLVLEADNDVSVNMIEWCIAELQHRSMNVLDTVHPPPVFVYNGDVYKSDAAVPMQVKKELQDAIVMFERQIPEHLRDWHPDSDGKVWDLVHPSLFPLVYNRSRVLRDRRTVGLEDCVTRCGEGSIAPLPLDHEVAEKDRWPSTSSSYRWSGHGAPVIKPYSKRFQWLPCEVDIAGKEARITSYINNLHPVHDKALYGLVEKIITAALPSWELTLAPLQRQYVPERRIDYSECSYNPDPEAWPASEGPQQEDNESDDAYWERRREWILETRKLVLPEPGPFRPLRRPEPLDLRGIYGKRGLQVIVKFANIQLTPEKPSYEGGSWHVEGQLNEHIVSTAVYYYSCDNISSSQLAFRQQTDTDVSGIYHSQNEHEWLSEVFGCENGGPGVQDIGSVETSEGRLLTFPNTLQHRVEPFHLADPTKSGHRKILALFLVDPNIKIISTANVPCQQKDWWWDVVLARQQSNGPLNPGGRAPGLAGLPVELLDHIYGYIVDDFPMDISEAKSLRLELMKERRMYVDDHCQAFESHTFSLCEH